MAGRDDRPREDFDARAGSPLRGLLLLPLVLAFTFGALLAMLPVVVLRPSTLARRSRRVLHAIGATQLRLLGVVLEVHGDEHLPASGPGLVFFNHQSLLDLALLCATWPARGTVVYKREFHRIPLMGRTMAAMGMVPIDRGDRARAIEALGDLGQRLRREPLVVLLAPEGSRSRRPGLLPFKRGPFHLALASGAPITPMILRGVRQLMPPGSWICRPGRVRVDYLPPIATNAWSTDTLDEQVAAVRARFLAWLPAAPDDDPSG